jgi:hypothetical protein
MSGNRKDDPTVNDEPALDRCEVRVISIYSLPWRYAGPLRRELKQELDLGKLKNHYDLYREQLPRLLPDDFFGDGAASTSLTLNEPPEGVTFTKSAAMLFALPSNQVVLAAVFSFDTGSVTGSHMAEGVRTITTVLEQCIDGNIGVRRARDQVTVPLGSYLDEALPGGKSEGGSPLLPERHQLVFITSHRQDSGVPTNDVINEIVYRDSPPYNEEFARPQRPEQLNLVRDNKALLGIVTSYVSLLWNHQPAVQDSIFLSTVHAVGTASTFRQIWHDSYRQVREFRDKGQAQEVGVQTRGALETLADKLGNLEFDLTFSVEFPLMRIETFHTALYEAMDLSGQAQALSQMFGQLGGSLRSEITAIDVRERRRDEGRQKWNAFAAGVLSLVGVSVGFVIAFLGVNTTQVPTADPGPLSMWDPKFASVYLVAGTFAVVPVFLIAFPYLRGWAGRRRDVWPPVAGLAVLLAGVFLVTGAYFVDENSGRTLVTDAIMKSIGLLAALVGLSMVLCWLWAKWGRSWWRSGKRRLARRPTGEKNTTASSSSGWTRSSTA